MIRLALNMASTRLILTNGHEGTDAAGYVIEAFGNFVMQGNYVIGIIVFAILVIVNFVVITKGSGRIAEVAARYTLDAMPGKQMAIDADLSAGLINEDEARSRRKELEDESSFFGAMDGASKFVRGDAIAGLMITFINIIGGMIVGVGQNGLSMAEAGQTYTLLTIGDGLVSQIPALIVSTAAGLLVSKAGVKGTADKALVDQLSSYPKALGMSSFVMAGMALLPGIPMVPFIGLSAVAGSLAWYAVKNKKERADKKVAIQQAEAHEAAEPEEEPISETLHMDELRLELGYGLVPMISDPKGDSDKLTEQIKALRRQLASDMGFVMPAVRILDNMQLPANDYIIKVKEVDAGGGALFPELYMAMDPQGSQIELPGNHTTEPTFGLPATWIESNLRDEASFKGYTVVDPVTVISTHLTEILKSHMSELLSYGEMQGLLDRLPEKSKKLLDDVVPGQISASTMQRVLQTLLGERVSIRDMSTILEGIAEASGFTQSVQPITEHVRARLARQICAAHVGANGTLPLITMSPQWEQEFAESLIGEGDDRQLAMVPSRLQEFIKDLRDAFEEAGEQGEAPVLLTSPAIRPFVRQIVERFRPQTPVLSQNEVHPQAKLKTIGKI